MSDKDYEQARQDNQTLVRAQRKSLGYSVREDKRDAVGRGLAHVTLFISEMKTEPSQEQLADAIEIAEKHLRKTLVDKGAFVDRVTSHKLLNGDIEVRAEYTMKRPNVS